MSKPLERLQVLGIRYLNARFIPGDGIPLDAYLNARAYDAASVPFEIAEPTLSVAARSEDEIANIGLLGGAIAEGVASAREKGDAVLMVGGNCCHITGVVGGLQDAHGTDARIGLVWFDAHGDFNTAKTTLSGMLGGMPVAVAAGLTHANWREFSHIAAPLPTERILMVDVRNLDPAEEQLIRATDVVIAAPALGFPGEDLESSVAALAAKVDLIYFHIDSDILDERYTPNHGTKEPNGPDMGQVKAAIETVMATGKVAAFAVVSVFGKGEGADVMVNSGIELIRSGLAAWKEYGMT